MEIANNVLTQEQIWEQRRYEAAKEFMSVIIRNTKVLFCSA